MSTFSLATSYIKNNIRDFFDSDKKDKLFIIDIALYKSSNFDESIKNNLNFNTEMYLIDSKYIYDAKNISLANILVNDLLGKSWSSIGLLMIGDNDDISISLLNTRMCLHPSYINDDPNIIYFKSLFKLLRKCTKNVDLFGVNLGNKVELIGLLNTISKENEFDNITYGEYNKSFSLNNIYTSWSYNNGFNYYYNTVNSLLIYFDSIDFFNEVDLLNLKKDLIIGIIDETKQLPYPFNKINAIINFIKNRVSNNSLIKN